VLIIQLWRWENDKMNVSDEVRKKERKETLRYLRCVGANDIWQTGNTVLPEGLRQVAHQTYMN